MTSEKAWKWLVGVTMAMGIASATGASASYQVVRSARLPNGLDLTQFRYSNGLQLYVIENDAAPVFTYQTWFNVGSLHEKLDPALQRTGLAHLFEHMMFRGTTQHGDGEFDRLLSEAGGDSGNATTWLDRTNYYQNLPKDQLDLILALESDRMVNLDIAEEVLETERGAVLSEYFSGLDDPDMVANDSLYEKAFVKHPYRYTTIGTEAEIRSFTRAEAMDFYRRYYSPNNAVIFVVGDLKAADVAKRVENFYGTIPSQALPTLVAEAEPAQTLERFHEFSHPQIQAEKLLLGYHAPGVLHADHAALQVASAILTLGEGAALTAAWVNAGLASELSGSLNQFRDPGLLILGAEIQPGRASGDLLGALDRVLSRLAAGVTEAELERARNQLLLSIYSQWEQNADLATYLGEFIFSAGDPLHGIALASQIERVTTADVQRVIAQYLNANQRTVVLGKAAP